MKGDTYYEFFSGVFIGETLNSKKKSIEDNVEEEVLIHDVGCGFRRGVLSSPGEKLYTLELEGGGTAVLRYEYLNQLIKVSRHYHE